MHIVALAQVCGDPDVEVTKLAAVLGLSPYDVRLHMSRVLPKIVHRSESAQDAMAVLAALRELGHGAVACDAAEAVPTSQMVRMHRFKFDDQGIWAHDEDCAYLAWDEIFAIVQATSRADLQRTTVEQERVMSARGYTVTVKREATTTEQLVEPVLYLFPRDSSTPWCLAENSAQYLALGTSMKQTRRGNFLETLALLRRKAIRAVFDDRFAHAPMPQIKTLQVRGVGEPHLDGTQPREAELTLHLLALWLHRSTSGPYRDAG